jgi:DNA-binding MarR family transcriptional regulator
MNDKKDVPVGVNINITQYICIFYKEFKRYSEEKLKPYKLTNGLYIYVIFVYKKPGCTLNEMSKALKVDKAHTTRSINKLIEFGYVNKITDEKDNRAFNIYPTEKCDEVMPKMKNLFVEWQQIMLDGFSKEEIEEFQAFFKKGFLNLQN